MSRIIDLSYPIITTHWRKAWKVELDEYGRIDGNELWNESAIKHMETHSFTHMDAPRHPLRDGKPIDQIPLSQIIGEASVIDVSYKGEREAITSEDLKKRGKHVEIGDIVLIKSNWGKKCSYADRKFWINAPFITADACLWLAKRGVKAVGFDFPFLGHERHRILLGKGIPLIEYLTNLDVIKKDRVKFFALPLKLKDQAGAPTRACAIEE